jgi:hypothetical protein
MHEQFGLFADSFFARRAKKESAKESTTLP